MSAELDLLKRYNAWRRGDDSEMIAPALLGVAIDYAINVIAAAENLVAVKGPRHLEQAYTRLETAVKNESSTKGK